MISDERICTIAEDWTGVGAVSIYDDVAEAIKQALQESTPLIRKQVIGEIADWLEEQQGNDSCSTVIKTLADQLRSMHSLPDKGEDITEKYNELIMAVCNKYPNESRHETALRYITERESSSNEGACKSAAPKESDDGN